MIDTSINLISKIFTLDSVGNQIPSESEVSIPIIRLETIYASEYYRASQAGFKPTLKIVISSLNYQDQDELEYKDKRYKIIRSEEINQDELRLVCEAKIYEYN